MTTIAIRRMTTPTIVPASAAAPTKFSDVAVAVVALGVTVASVVVMSFVTSGLGDRVTLVVVMAFLLV